MMRLLFTFILLASVFTSLLITFMFNGLPWEIHLGFVKLASFSLFMSLIFMIIGFITLFMIWKDFLALPLYKRIIYTIWMVIVLIVIVLGLSEKLDVLTDLHIFGVFIQNSFALGIGLSLLVYIILLINIKK